MPLTPAVTAHAFDLLRGTLTYSDKASPAGFPESGGYPESRFFVFAIFGFAFWFLVFRFWVLLCKCRWTRKFYTGRGHFISGPPPERFTSLFEIAPALFFACVRLCNAVSFALRHCDRAELAFLDVRTSTPAPNPKPSYFAGRRDAPIACPHDVMRDLLPYAISGGEFLRPPREWQVG